MRLTGFRLIICSAFPWVRSYQGHSSRSPNCLCNPTQTSIHVLTRLYSFIEFTRVPNHVGVCKVNDENIALVFFDTD